MKKSIKVKRMIIMTVSLILTLIIFLIILPNKDKNPININGITITIKEESLNEKGATVIITDLTKDKNTYDEWYEIQKFDDKKWNDLQEKEKQNWLDPIGYKADHNNQIEFEIDWEQRYGILETGIYRVIKKVNNEYIAVEFTVDS